MFCSIIYNHARAKGGRVMAPCPPPPAHAYDNEYGRYLSESLACLAVVGIISSQKFIGELVAPYSVCKFYSLSKVFVFQSISNQRFISMSSAKKRKIVGGFLW